MITTLIRCDNCGNEERDPAGWFQLLHNGTTAITISRFDPAYHSQSKLQKAQCCSLNCVHAFQTVFFEKQPAKKKRAKS